MNELLTIEKLDVKYGDIGILRGVSLSVGEGEIVGVVGESGSGKSTMTWVWCRDCVIASW